jgi:hypothetical protein
VFSTYRTKGRAVKVIDTRGECDGDRGLGDDIVGVGVVVQVVSHCC